MSQGVLRELLARYLKGEEMGKYPTVETKIIQLSPLQITDDQQTFIDLSSLEDSVTEELGGSMNSPHKLILQDWKFVFRRIPNSHEYYFDLSVNRYKLEEDQFMRSLDRDPIKMEDVQEIRFLFEKRKRAEIEKMVRSGSGVKDTPTRSELLAKSPSKLTLGNNETLPSTKPSEIKQPAEDSASVDVQKALFKPSTTKTEAGKSSLYFDSSFFRQAGVVSVGPKMTAEEAMYLTIAEIMSVRAFIPQVKKSVIRPVPLIRLRRSLSTETNLDELQRESISKMVQRYSTESSRDSRQQLDFEDVQDYIKTGQLKWEQIVFGRSTFDYLNKHQFLIKQAE